LDQEQDSKTCTGQPLTVKTERKGNIKVKEVNSEIKKDKLFITKIPEDIIVM
jgi:hypothetical protein